MQKLLLILLWLPMIGFGQQTYIPDDDFEVESPCIILPSEINDQEINRNNKKLIQIKDILGQKTSPKQNIILFYIYNDETVEKRIIIE